MPERWGTVAQPAILDQEGADLDRRLFLTRSVGLATLAMVPGLSYAQEAQFWQRDRTLWLARADTQESFHVVFWSQGQYDPDNYVRLCYIMRDARARSTVQMYPRLFDLLYAMQQWRKLTTGGLSPIILTSGYRTQQTNSALEGAARNSLHLYGAAGDIRIPGCTPQEVAGMATHFKVGGVGTYPAHTHVDIGPVRTWYTKSYKKNKK